MVDWVGLVVPFAYIGILVGSLATFASLYRKRKAAKSASLEPWFDPHMQRNIYLTLLHLEQTEPGKEKPINVPDSVIKAALLRRATENIHRLISIRSSKQALSSLLARGSVGDELWQRFLRAEQEMEEEIKDVVNEANALAPGWGSTIFQSANEMASNAILRERVDRIQTKVKEDREWWNRKRESTQAEFLKELDEESQPASVRSSVPALAPTQEKTPAEEPVAAPAQPTPSRPSTSASERVASDEDTVLVESGGPTSPTTPGLTGSVKGKKKKGKK